MLRLLFGLVLLSDAHAGTAQLQDCHTSIAGAGPGGIYFAWRLAEANPASAAGICIFERSERFGGRIFTLKGLGPDKDLTVEMGAYRFNNASMESWSNSTGSYEFLYTPLTAALIQNAFHLPAARYEIGNPESTMLKIVDSKGNNAGYHTFVEKMMNETISYGVRTFYNHALHSILPLPAGGVQLQFESGEQMNTSELLLNLPQVPLLKVLQQSTAFFQHHKFQSALQAVEPGLNAKLYVYYEDAWWRNYLNLSSGNFTIGIDGQQEPPLKGRYHDGDTRCKDGTCRGFLEATYVGKEDARWFLTHQLNRDPSFSLINTSVPDGELFLKQVHKALFEYHAAALATAGKTSEVQSMTPPFAYLSYWDSASVGFGGGTHMTRKGRIPVQQVPLLSMQPFEGTRLFVANEAFGSMRNKDASLGEHHGWAECSLQMAENVLNSKFGVPPPTWIDPSIHAKWVKYPDALDGASLLV